MSRYVVLERVLLGALLLGAHVNMGEVLDTRFVLIAGIACLIRWRAHRDGTSEIVERDLDERIARELVLMGHDVEGLIRELEELRREASRDVHPCIMPACGIPTLYDETCATCSAELAAAIAWNARSIEGRAA